MFLKIAGRFEYPPWLSSGMDPGMLRPVSHVSFDAIFVALSNATFVAIRACKRFRCDSSCDVCCNFPQIAPKLHQVSNMFETCAIQRRQIAQKSY